MSITNVILLELETEVLVINSCLSILTEKSKKRWKPASDTLIRHDTIDGIFYFCEETSTCVTVVLSLTF